MRTNWAPLPDDISEPSARLVDELRALKDAKGLTLLDLAAGTHYSRSSWERWLNGKRPVTRSALERFAVTVGADSGPLLALHALLDSPDGPDRADGPDRPAAPPAAAVAGAAGAESTGGARGAAAQLPADTRMFTGRDEELDGLVALLKERTVVISAIDGMAGIGKTALAVHAAHRMREDFPDGQLFLDLHGHTTGIAPLESGAALDRLLRSLGVSPQLIPLDPHERSAFLRDRLAGTRTLIVLDNAASTAQVRPLLPGTPGCLVLVTSRRRLTGLDDAHTLALDTLPGGEATSLLHKVAGPGRIPDGHPAADELIALCGHMPLAIRIAAARLRHHRALRVEDLVEQLRDEHGRLDRLRDEDRNLTVVFESSYLALPEAEQQLFRRLGQVPGPDFDGYAAANLLGTDLRTAEALLESLLDHNLLAQHASGRYRFHDLVRLYARTLRDDSPALDRLLGYYQHTAQAADAYITRHTRSSRPLAAAPPAAPELSGTTAALAWMRAERDNLLAGAAHAAAERDAARPRPEQAVAITAAVAGFLRQEGLWQQAAALHRTAAELAQRNGDRRAQADAVWELGRVRYMTGDTEEAVALIEQALADYTDLGDRQGAANASRELGRLRYLHGRPTEALVLLHRALSVYEELGDRRGEANTLFDLGRAQHDSGNYAVSVALQERAREIHLDSGDRLGQADALWELGRVHHSSGDFTTACDLLEQALTLYQGLGNRNGEANLLWSLGRARRMTGEITTAADLFRRALWAYRDSGHRLGQANTLWELGRMHCTAGDFAAAADLHGQALEMFQELGSFTGMAIALLELGRVRHGTRDYPAAVGYYRPALAMCREHGLRQIEATVLDGLGRVQQAAGELSAANDSFNSSLTMFREIGDRHGEAVAVTGMAALIAETAGPAQALELYRRALDLARELHSPVDEARALDGAAQCLARLGETAAAAEELEQAAALYRRSGAFEATAAEEQLTALRRQGPRAR
jgi:tetratricopeptide (TPR) repeat protein/transcriptional regulator with XRE-family HTH domain